MEQNWDNRNRRDDRYYDDRNIRGRDFEGNRYENIPQDPNTYRGAYRLDNSSDHRHISTYNWSGDRGHPYERIRERRGPVNEQYRERRDYDENYYPGEQRPDFRNDNRNDRYNNREEWENRSPAWKDYMDHSDRWGSSNFNNDYGPDHYPHRQGENIGNMAGTLSYGYDGDRLSNPDFDRRYNPLTGEVRHEREIRHQRHQGKNPSSYRWLNLSEERRY